MCSHSTSLHACLVTCEWAWFARSRLTDCGCGSPLVWREVAEYEVVVMVLSFISVTAPARRGRTSARGQQRSPITCKEKARGEQKLRLVE